VSEEINVFLLFSATYNETAGLWSSRVRRHPNELSGIHTDVALSPPKRSRCLAELMNPIKKREVDFLISCLKANIQL